MTSAARNRIASALRAIWDKRDIPHIPVTEFRRLTDADLAYLYRFWSHKDRHWVKFDAISSDKGIDVVGDDAALARQPDFTEEPPKGWKRFWTDPLPSHTDLGVLNLHSVPSADNSVNFGRQFKSVGGGHLVLRQQEKKPGS